MALHNTFSFLGNFYISKQVSTGWFAEGDKCNCFCTVRNATVGINRTNLFLLKNKQSWRWVLCRMIFNLTEDRAISVIDL